MKNIISLGNKLMHAVSEKSLINAFLRYRKRLYLIGFLILFALILYRLTFLPYFNIVFNPTVIFYSIIFLALMILQLSPKTLIKLVVVFFAFAIIPSLFNIYKLIDIIGNVAFIFLFAAAILYVYQIKKEK